MSNQVYEFSGTVDVLIKCRVDTTIGGITYKANEPYTYLKDVDFRTRYNAINSNASTKNTVMHVRDGDLGEVVLNTVPLSDKIAKLVLTYDGTNNSCKTVKQQIKCWDNGSLSLLNTPVDSNIFCYNANMQLVPCTKNDNTLLGDFVAGETYLVFYNVTVDGTKYLFDSPTYPYFELQVFGKGNKDKVTNEVFMLFPKVALTSVPRLNNMGGGIISTDLNFRIVYSEKGDTPLIAFK